MFALRKISSNGGEINFDLGDNYSLITKERSPEEFEDKMISFKSNLEKLFSEGKSLEDEIKERLEELNYV